MDASCNLLDYRRHHSICYIHLFTTSRRYNLSFTMSYDPLMACLGAVLGSPLSFLLSLSVLNADSKLTFNCQSQSHIATDGQSVSKSWCRAPSGTYDQIFSTVCQLRSCFFLWGALSDERTGLSFVRVIACISKSFVIM
jgi:hypothetical protein